MNKFINWVEMLEPINFQMNRLKWTFNFFIKIIILFSFYFRKKRNFVISLPYIYSWKLSKWIKKNTFFWILRTFSRNWIFSKNDSHKLSDQKELKYKNESEKIHLCEFHRIYNFLKIGFLIISLSMKNCVCRRSAL